MNEQTHAVTSSPAELSFQEMSAVHGAPAFGTSQTPQRVPIIICSVGRTAPAHRVQGKTVVKGIRFWSGDRVCDANLIHAQATNPFAQFSEFGETRPMMNEAFSRRSPGPRLSAWIVVVMLAMVALPASITLSTVRSPAKLEMTNSDPTPHGYTWSLLLFILPTGIIALGFLPREEFKLPRKAFCGQSGF